MSEMEILVVLTLAVLMLSIWGQGTKPRRHRASARPRSRSRRCAVCRRLFWAGRSHRITCSDECRRRREKAQKRTEHARRRARKRRAPSDKIDPMDVLERDGWVCQLCGRTTPKSQRGSCEPTAPEVDHIMPLSRGGSHTLSNLQVLCRRCNLRKSNKVTGRARRGVTTQFRRPYTRWHDHVSIGGWVLALREAISELQAGTTLGQR